MPTGASWSSAARTPAELNGKEVAGNLLQGPAFEVSDGVQTVEALMRTADDRMVPVEVIRRPFRSGVRGNEVYAIRDLTERHRNEARIAHMAHHDALTDLPNRILLRERLEPALKSRRRDEHLALLSSTSTASRRSTTRSAIPSATPCSQGCPPADRLRARVRYGGAHSAATNSSIPAVTPPIRGARRPDLAERIIEGVISAPYKPSRAMRSPSAPASALPVLR